MSNALHDYAKLFERYAANNGGTGAILAGEDCLSLANEMRMDADAIDAENAKLRELVAKMARALGVNSEWCDRDCEREFDCNWLDECPIESAMKELGVKVDDGTE